MEKKLTIRQEKIMDVVVREYVNSAQPVSSKLLEKKYKFDISPATIRNEMQKLTDEGFLLQPHTSAGRVPTDKGYRFFVNNLLEKKSQENGRGNPKSLALEKLDGNSANLPKKSDEDIFKFIQEFTRKLAEETSALALNYFEDEDMFWKEGWEDLLREPEFGERDNIIDFTQVLQDLEKHIDDLKKDRGVSVHIGGENPFPKAKNFTVISSHYTLPGGGEGVISILGPKRMAYEKNINLINSLMKLLDNF
jgi:transcriptional regulator of heat shock response